MDVFIQLLLSGMNKSKKKVSDTFYPKMDENLVNAGDDFAMPTPIRLPNDPFNRYWVELAGVYPHLVDQMRPALVTFIAFDKDKSIASSTSAGATSPTYSKPRDNMVGTGFIIGARAEQGLGLVLTAKHVLDGIHAVQTPRQRHSPSTPSFFVPARHTLPTLDPRRLKIIWMGTDAAELMNATWASYYNPTDIACCAIVPQQEDPCTFHPATIPIDTRVPSVGEIVHLVSIDKMSATELVAPMDRTGVGQVLEIYRRISIRRGTVTGVHPNGFGAYKWPCFTTTIPITGGMSGGFVYVPRDGETVSACGVVCADIEPHITKTDQTVCGVSVIGCTWPALALRLLERVSAHENAPTRSLLEMAKLGRIPMPIGDIDRFSVETLENGDYRLNYR